MDLSLRSLIGSSFIIWIIGAILGIIYLFTISNGSLVFRENRIKFGIDLKGGTYITLGVQTNKAIEVELNDKVETLKKKMQKEGRELASTQKIEHGHVELTFSSEQEAHAAESFFASNDPALKMVVTGNQLSVSLKDSYAQIIREWAVKSNINVLRTRLDNLGVGEIPITAQGENNIIVELPNIDPERAKVMIGKSALLEIKLIEDRGPSEEAILDKYDGELPEGMVILPGKGRGMTGMYYLVPAFTDLTGRLLKDAYAGFAQNQSNMVVHFKFNQEGGERFYELTRKNPRRQLAVIIDGVVISDPKINQPIGAEGYIMSDDFTRETAAELASLLKSGAFVAPVTIEAERQIGPSLGEESIRQGLIACLVGLALLLVFGVIVYKVAGLLAFITLLFNLLLILIALAWLQATLTLPGIAGMVLTVGMAIDASILIYERIREELTAGITMRKAVQTGFSDAMEVILDSNITTFIVGLVLFKFGSGPIQGFAITMMIGIISTLLTGLFFLRSIFTFLLHNMGMQNIKI